MNNVFDLPGRPRSCFLCVHYLAAFSHCELYDEDIDSEIQAAHDCPSFETPEHERASRHGTDQ